MIAWLALLLLMPRLAWADAYSAAVLLDGPHAYFRMNATSGTTEPDLGTNGLNLTYAGGFTLNQPGHLVSSGAAQFNGTTGRAENSTPAPGASPGGASVVTVEFWANTSTSVGQRAVVAHNNAGGTDYDWVVGFNGTKVWMNGWDNLGAQAATVTGTTTIATGAWHMYNITMSEGAPLFQTYVDCVLDGSSGTMTDVMDGGANAGLAVGRRQDNVMYYSGYVQEVAVFNKPSQLSVPQMCAHFNAGAVLPGRRRIIDGSSGRRLLYGLARLKSQRVGPAIPSWFEMEDRALE